MNNLEKAFDDTYADRILSDISPKPHAFSPAFNRKMKKLLKATYGSDRASTIMYPKQIIKFAIIAALLAVLTVSVSGSNVVQLRNYETYSMFFVDDTAGTPETIEDVFTVTADMTGFEKSVDVNEPYLLITRYSDDKSGANIIFSQMTVASVQGMRLNTENVEGTVTTLRINGYDAICFKTTTGIRNIIWDNSEYVFMLEASGIGKDTLIEIACSVQNAEK